MLNLSTSLIWPGCAQGKYTVRAKGHILAVLSWGDAEAPLPGWGPFAYVPIDPAGNGTFFYPGRRGIPRGTTHVWARCYASDFGHREDVSAAIPAKYLPTADEHDSPSKFSVLTDLHLAAKPGRVRQALRAAESNTILLLGDSTNDGLRAQFATFETCVEDAAPQKTVLPVAGNHDVLHPSRCGGSDDGCGNYEDFQSHLLTKAEKSGCGISHDPDGRAYAARVGGFDVIGLQCVTAGRRFTFPQGRQLDWLEEHLADTSAPWHIVLCHAPLLAHNPARNTGAPYLGGNGRLQEIVNRAGRVIFLSGHTHVSPNVLAGNGEYDERHRNVYLDCGSVVPTDTSGENGMMSPDWKDGCVTELSVTESVVEICMRSISSGARFPRGYYRFETEPS